MRAQYLATLGHTGSTGLRRPACSSHRHKQSALHWRGLAGSVCRVGPANCAPRGRARGSAHECARAELELGNGGSRFVGLAADYACDLTKLLLITFRCAPVDPLFRLRNSFLRASFCHFHYAIAKATQVLGLVFPN